MLKALLYPFYVNDYCITWIVFVLQLRIGDWVWLAEKAESNILVATGQVSGLADGGMFHNRPIPKKYVRINVESVAVNVPLYVPVDEADQTTLTDALGSSVLWPTRLTFRKIWWSAVVQVGQFVVKNIA